MAFQNDGLQHRWQISSLSDTPEALIGKGISGGEHTTVWLKLEGAELAFLMAW